MTQGDISKVIVRFAVPLLWGNLFQQLYNVVDSLVVGNFAGQSALAAVSSSGSLMQLMVGFIHGAFMGMGVVVSRCMGAKDDEYVSKATHTMMLFSAFCGIVLTFMGVVLTPVILRMMGTPADVLPNSILYTRIVFAGSLFNVLYNAANGVFNAVGDSKHPLYYLIISSVLNVILDLILVGGFHMGVAGAAWATITSHAASAWLALHRLGKEDAPWRLSWDKLHIDGGLLKMGLRVGIPSGLSGAMISIANVFVQSNINSFGTLAMAGCGVYQKIEGFAFLPINAFSMAMTTFTGQNLGAGERERVKKGAIFGVLCCVIMSETIGLLLHFFGEYVVVLFNNNPEVIAYGTSYSKVTGKFFFLLSASHCIAGVLRGAGKSLVPMVVMMVFWCFVRVSYLSLVIPVVRDIRYVFWAYPMTWLMSTVTMLIYTLKSNWLDQTNEWTGQIGF